MSTSPAPTPAGFIADLLEITLTATEQRAANSRLKLLSKKSLSATVTFNAGDLVAVKPPPLEETILDKGAKRKKDRPVTFNGWIVPSSNKGVLTIQVVETIRQLHKADLASITIGRTIGISTVMVEKVLHANGKVNNRIRRNKVPQEDKEQIQKLAASGKSVKEIIAITKWSHTTVRNYLDKIGYVWAR